MNCQDFANLMDRLMLVSGDRLRRDELEHLESHASGCAECHAALAACDALQSDPIPGLAGGLVHGSIVAMSQRRSLRWRVPIVAGALGAGAFALATTGWLGFGLAGDRDDAASATAVTDVAANPQATGSDDLASFAELAPIVQAVTAAEQREHEAFASSRLDQSGLPDGEYFALLKVAPRYPKAAAEAGIAGSALVEFTINKAGDIEDPFIVESTDPAFDATTLEATAQFKYKPRVVDGQSVAVQGVRTIFRYELEQLALESETGDGESDGSSEETTAIDDLTYMRLLQPAYGCLSRNDLLCVELELDKLRAIQPLSPAQLGDVWHIYGFVHHRRGRYQLALESYQNAADPAGGANEWTRARSLAVVARIHYELEQYQQALDAMIEYLKVAPNVMMHDYLFVDELRALGAQVR